MTEDFELSVAGDPKPKGSLRAYVVKGRPVIVQGKEARSWEYLLAEAINAKRCGPVWDGPVIVELIFRLRRPKAAKKRAYPQVRPDIDKLARTVLDALVSGGLLEDDAQVVALGAQKLYADNGNLPGVIIKLRRAA